MKRTKQETESMIEVRHAMACRPFVDMLLAMSCESRLTDEDMRRVVGLVGDWHIGTEALTWLDARPGFIGYKEEQGGWHWKLRQVRNHPVYGRALWNAADRETHFAALRAPAPTRKR